MQYAQPITKKGAAKAPAAAEEPAKKSNHVQRILEERKKGDITSG
jgi:small subunit ribosomal protein S8e